VNILNKRSRTDDNGWSSSWGWGSGLGLGLSTAHCKKQACYKMLHRASDLDRFFGSVT
jgi:hypothetical protein